MSDGPEAQPAPGASGVRRLPWLAWAAYLGFCALLFPEVWLGSARLIARDLLQYFVPIGETLAQAWRGGGSFLWDSGINNGMPFAARWGPAVFYPAHALFAVLPVQVALTVAVLLHLPIAAIATMQLALRYTASRPAAWLSGLGYAFGGYCLSMTGGGVFLYGAALLPLDLLALHRLIERPGAMRLVQLALVVALQVLCCDPQTLFFGVLVLWPLTLLLRARGGARARTWLAAAGAGALGLLLAACQLWPTVELAGQSLRATGFDYPELARWALHPLRTLELLVPSGFGAIIPENTYWARSLINNSEASMPWAPAIHVGLALLVGAAWLSRRAAPRDLLLWGGATLVCFLCALGPHTPVHRVLVTLLPGADRFRYPEKFMVFVSLGLALLGGMGLGRLVSLDAAELPRRRGLAVLGAIALLLAALRLSCYPGSWLAGLIGRQSAVSVPDGMRTTAEALTRAGAMALLLLALLLLWPRLRPRLRTGLLLFVAGADLLLAALPLRHLGGESWLRERPLACRHVPAPERGLAPLIWRLDPGVVPDGPLGRGLGSRMEKQRRWEWHSLLANLGTPTCVRHLDGYEAAQLGRYKLLLTELARHRPEALPRVFGLRLALAAPGRLDPRRYPVRSEMPELGMRFHEMPGLPYAYGVGVAELVASSEDAVARIIRPDFAVDSRVILEGTSPLAVGPPARRSAELIQHRSGRIELRTDFAAPGYLVVLETHYPGWVATVDGRAADLRRANGLFIGLPISAGRHRVTLSFEPRRQRVGSWVSAIALSGALLVMLAGWRLRRASNGASPR